MFDRLKDRQKTIALELALLSLLGFFPLVHGLGDPPINLWDEARGAINALEMMNSSNPLAVTYHGEPDLWNTKPPGNAWILSSMMSLLGVSEWSLRASSAIAGYSTAVIVWLFVRTVCSSRSAGVLAAAVLLSTQGYVGTHATRTADYDALTVFFTTGAAMAAFLSLNRGDLGRGGLRWLYAFAALTCLAILIKGVAGLLLLPGLAIFVTLEGKLITLIRARAFWISAVSIMLFTVALYGARELAQPGYLAAVQENELGGRFGKVIEGRTGPWYFYIEYLLGPWPYWLRFPTSSEEYPGSAFPWSWLFPITALAGTLSIDPALRRVARWSMLVIISYLVLISTSATKNSWYLVQVFPFLAMSTAVGVRAIATAMNASSHPVMAKGGQAAFAMAASLAVFMIAVVTYKNERLTRAAATMPSQQTSHFIKAVFEQYPQLSPVRIMHDGHGFIATFRDGRLFGSEPYNAPEEFYIILLRWRGLDVSLVRSGYHPSAGETVLSCRAGLKQMPLFDGEVLKQNEHCRAVRAR